MKCWLCSTSSGGSVAGGHCGRCDCCRPLASPGNYANSDLARKRAGGSGKNNGDGSGCLFAVAPVVAALALAFTARRTTRRPEGGSHAH
jgi:hypothetical protein